MKRDEIERFDIVAPSGRRVTLVRYQNYRPHRPTSGETQWLPSSTELVISDGGPVQENGDEKYELFDSDEVFERI